MKGLVNKGIVTMEQAGHILTALEQGSSVVIYGSAGNERVELLGTLFKYLDPSSNAILFQSYGKLPLPGSVMSRSMMIRTVGDDTEYILSGAEKGLFLPSKELVEPYPHYIILDLVTRVFDYGPKFLKQKDMSRLYAKQLLAGGQFITTITDGNPYTELFADDTWRIDEYTTRIHEILSNRPIVLVSMRDGTVSEVQDISGIPEGKMSDLSMREMIENSPDVFDTPRGKAILIKDLLSLLPTT